VKQGEHVADLDVTFEFLFGRLEPDIFWIYNQSMSARKKGRGRPRKVSGQTKSESVLLRMEAREKKGFAEAAELAGLPLAVWMRERLRRAAQAELTTAGAEIPFLSKQIEVLGKK
jgi:hypothetical protein